MRETPPTLVSSVLKPFELGPVTKDVLFRTVALLLQALLGGLVFVQDGFVHGFERARLLVDRGAKLDQLGAQLQPTVRARATDGIDAVGPVLVEQTSRTAVCAVGKHRVSRIECTELVELRSEHLKGPATSSNVGDVVQ